jgi:pimeloyl-ACP methyl ester carboxylesterase
LDALLDAANVSGPYVLVGASWGGMIANLFARTHPNQVAGLVFVDGASEHLETTLTPNQWADWMDKAKGRLAVKDAEVPDYVPSVQQLRERPVPENIPTVVLTSDKPWDLQVGDTGSTWSAWLEAQDLLTEQFNATHISKTNSGHGIAVEQPQLVVEAIRQAVEESRIQRTATPK